MRIQSINPTNTKNTNPVFGHTFKVSICVRESENDAYQFVHPIKNAVLYKSLMSRLVGWLNSDYLAKLRAQSGIICKKPARILTERDKTGKKLVQNLLEWLDTDYKKHPQVRSVYTRKGLGYLATGKDVDEIKNECEAGNIGPIKHEAIEFFDNTHTPEVESAVRNYRRKSIKYVKASENLLRSPNSNRELMLRLNFIQTGVRKNKPVYKYDCCDFYAIKSS